MRLVEESKAFAESIEEGLARFTGTTQYHRHCFGMHYTDGVQYLAQRAGAYWLIDVIASWQTYIRQIDDDFHLWEFIVHEDRSAGLFARLDSKREHIASQKFHYTDFPLRSITLWVEGGVLLLPSEH